MGAWTRGTRAEGAAGASRVLGRSGWAGSRRARCLEPRHRNWAGARNAGTRERVAGKGGDEGRERETPARREMRAGRATEAEKQGLGASSEGEREQKGLQAGGRAIEASSGRARHGR
jgi:hypothetical protein